MIRTEGLWHQWDNVVLAEKEMHLALPRHHDTVNKDNSCDLCQFFSVPSKIKKSHSIHSHLRPLCPGFSGSFPHLNEPSLSRSMLPEKKMQIHVGS